MVTISVTVLAQLIGNGPAFKLTFNEQVDNCDKKLWRNLLYISNNDITDRMVRLKLN